MKCGCGCSAPIQVGSQFTRYAGHPWKVEHLIAYKARRRQRMILK